MPTDNPLILYYAGPDRHRALDALAAVKQLLERHPGAETMACKDGPLAAICCRLVKAGHIERVSHGRYRLARAAQFEVGS
jgi:predicted transcriptional regulator of viral defense system